MGSSLFLRWPSRIANYCRPESCRTKIWGRILPGVLQCHIMQSSYVIQQHEMSLIFFWNTQVTCALKKSHDGTASHHKQFSHFWVVFLFELICIFGAVFIFGFLLIFGVVFIFCSYSFYQEVIFTSKVFLIHQVVLNHHHL